MTSVTLMTCRACEKHISQNAHFCPGCGEPYRKGNGDLRSAQIGVGGVMWGVFLGAFILPAVIAIGLFLLLGTLGMSI